VGLSAVADLLRCPVCGAGLALAGAALACGSGHAFDVARQGYATLSRRGIRHPGDTAGMVAARERVHAAGVLGAVTAAVTAAVPEGTDALADVGAGVGTYAVAVLAAGRARRAVALDASKPALRRAARAHPSLGAVGCDLLEGIPLRDAALDAAVVAFAPRTAEEVARVVRPGGTLVVVTPRPDHLAELADPLGLLDVPADKATAVAAALAAAFEPLDRLALTDRVPVDRATAADLARMGPLGHHVTADELADRAALLPDEPVVTVSVDVTTLRRRRPRPSTSQI
jgi:23S rRNA (guanine745-N1)-methyltransferase